MVMGNPYGDSNVRSLAEKFAANGGEPNKAPTSDKNNNGVPDKEEMTLKISRPVPQQMPQLPNKSPDATIQPFMPNGMNMGNMGQFLKTPAGGEMVRRIVGRLNPDNNPMGISMDNIFKLIQKGWKPRPSRPGTPRVKIPEGIRSPDEMVFPSFNTTPKNPAPDTWYLQ